MKTLAIILAVLVAVMIFGCNECKPPEPTDQYASYSVGVSVGYLIGKNNMSDASNLQRIADSIIVENYKPVARIIGIGGLHQ